MKKLIFWFLLLFFIFPSSAFSQGNLNESYVVESFNSQIEVNKDTSLTITETIKARFNTPKHGIFRVIPDTYSAKGKTIRAKLKILSVTNEQNIVYQYSVSRLNQSLQIKIGDPNTTLTGLQTYKITYNISKVLLSYQDHEEVYWNVTGSEWDTTLKNVSVTVNSPLAKITKVECFAGSLGLKEKDCAAEFDNQKASFTVNNHYSWGKDFTIVLALDKENQLNFPGPVSKAFNALADNWGYLAALMPLLIIFLIWYSKGRDLKYLTDNVYIKPESNTSRTVGLFEREHLPLVYSPINGLTPAEIGTIIDEKVDTKDIIAEIVELARLGFLSIKRTQTKKLLRTETEYTFTKKEKDKTILNDYQTFLLEKIFKDGNEITLSKLKNHFYQNLEPFRKKLIGKLTSEKIFEGDPKKARVKWGCLSAFIVFIGFFAVVSFIVTTANSGPQLLLFLTIIPIIFLVKNMPRRTAWGHSLYRQIVGLKFYINEGKWREEISEKNLFLEEILPLAICLGVVDKLAHDMKTLGIEPPSYLNGFTTTHFVSEFNHFNSHTLSNLASSPAGTTWSGSSHWSGGSGFSGGSGSAGSGGGFGGGGGGSW